MDMMEKLHVRAVFRSFKLQTGVLPQFAQSLSDKCTQHIAG